MLSVGESVPVIAAAVRRGARVGLLGRPGIGKTDAMHEVARLTGRKLIVTIAGIQSPTDAAGIYWPQPGEAFCRAMPLEQLHSVLTATEPVLWLLDDFGQAPAATQAMYMQWFLGGRLNEHVLPDCVSMAFASNGREHRAGVSGILAPVLGRVTLLDLGTDVQSWVQWALGADIHPHVIAFLRHRPNLLPDDTLPDSDTATPVGMVNGPSPRNWVRVSEWLNDAAFATFGPRVQADVVSGDVGKGAAGEFLAFRTMLSSVVSADQVLLDPSGAPIPDNLSALSALAACLAHRVNDSTFGRLRIYCERLLAAGRGPHAALAVRDSVRRKPQLVHSTEYTRMVSGEFGRLVMGEVAD